MGCVAWTLACSSSTKDAETPEQPESEAAQDDEPGTLEKANESVDRAHQNLKKNIKPVVGPIDEGVKKGVKNAKEATGLEGDEEEDEKADGDKPGDSAKKPSADQPSDAQDGNTEKPEEPAQGQ